MISFYAWPNQAMAGRYLLSPKSHGPLLRSASFRGAFVVAFPVHANLPIGALAFGLCFCWRLLRTSRILQVHALAVSIFD